MNRQEILNQMKLAIQQDRERFFKIADTLHLQPKYADKVASGELEAVKQQWRDMTTLPDYPNITFPLHLPEWFPKVHFASNWVKDKHLEEMLKKDNI